MENLELMEQHLEKVEQKLWGVDEHGVKETPEMEVKEVAEEMPESIDSQVHRELSVYKLLKVEGF